MEIGKLGAQGLVEADQEKNGIVDDAAAGDGRRHLLLQRMAGRSSTHPPTPTRPTSKGERSLP